MFKPKSGLWRLLLIPAALIILYLITVFFFMDFTAERWWFESLGYGGYFWQRQTYRHFIFTSVTLVLGAIFFVNLWLASHRFRKRSGDLDRATSPETTSHRVGLWLERFSYRFYLPLCLVLAAVIAVPFAEKWEQSLLFFFSHGAGAADPVFGRDISFYLFSLPVYQMIQDRLLVVFLVLLFTTAALYWLEWRLSPKPAGPPLRMRVHIGILIVIAALLEIWGQWLQRYSLLYEKSNPLFFGPSYVQMRIDLPLIWLTVAAMGVLSVAFLVYLYRGKGLKIVLILAAITLLIMASRRTTALHGLVQKYIVKPNEISAERPYIQNSIAATLQAYRVDRVERREYALTNGPLSASSEALAAVIHNIPVWDGELLEDVFKQLQGIRPYYDFSGVDVDRYRIARRYRQVYVGPREISIDNLPDAAKNWINIHLKYTHGSGAVMTPAAQDGEQPLRWYLRDIPPRSDYGVELRRPAIYYGLERYDYIIAPNDTGEIAPSSGQPESTENYHGQGGVPLSSLFKKLFFALYLHDSNIFFTTKTNDSSRILFRRNIVERIRTLTPFLKLDRDPYLVILPQGLFWIVDAYTHSNRYPNADPMGFPFNYVRNAVKITVDAYNGRVGYYIADPKDPIINTYRRIYPGLFKPLTALPKELKPHLRYPRDLFEIQMAVYAKYHQQDPATFYNQEDVWEFAKIYRDDEAVAMKPYYLTVNLLEPTRHEFQLLVPFSPKNLDTLRALAVVGCDGTHYGKITVFRFPKGRQVLGPSQVNAIIDQDTTISQEFTLWNQVGSAVERGKMLIIPVAGTILYVQPVYLKSAARLKIPELKRIILSQNEMVVMDTTLDGAFDKLQGRLRALRKRRAASRSSDNP